MHATRNMAQKYSPWIFFLHLLIIMVHPFGTLELVGSGTDINKFLEAKATSDEDHQTTHTEHKHGHSHMHMDPSVMVFFTLKDLKVGKTMPVCFPKRDPSTSPKLWPREEAEPLPFSLDQLPNLLKFFSLTPHSPQAKAMQDTLSECESKPIKGEVKFCATSLESMLDFTQTILGSKSGLNVFATSHLTKSSITFQNYTILENIMEIIAPKMVACHTMPYPYAVFYCHSQESENKIYRVSLAGENGDRLDAMAVCHMDTSQWGRGHVSFQVLKIQPGTSSVCHFFPADNLIFVPKLQSHDSATM
uniref:BURP domain-containing protein 3 n=1 Tax=Cajanus cajan TaxID=3821 RepID=A0A151TG85_CAJCA|nr:BURP domain-containing protein 3 [Cajanus cajan]